jgi:hypothetical protein
MTPRFSFPVFFSPGPPASRVRTHFDGPFEPLVQFPADVLEVGAEADQRRFGQFDCIPPRLNQQGGDLQCFSKGDCKASSKASGNFERQQRRQGYSPRYSLPALKDSLDLMMGKDIIEPFFADSKRNG